MKMPQQQKHDNNAVSSSSSSVVGSIFVFVMGFICSKGFDMMYQIKDLKNLLQEGNIVVSPNEKKTIVYGVKPISTGFDAIVKTAVDRAMQQPPLQSATTAGSRNVFDVNWWETSSNLTTGGGLNHNDRAAVGKIYGEASSVFEYGLGESTYIANFVGVPRYAGIDSDPVWVGMARDKVSPNYRFYLGDIGSTREWGIPNSPNNYKNVLNYQLLPLIAEPLPFDVYMVDGRWRLPTMLACFLHASDRQQQQQAQGQGVGGGDNNNSNNNTIVMIHDCTRGIYRSADHLLDLLAAESTTNLCVYKRKPSTTDQQLKELWDQHKDVVAR